MSLLLAVIASWRMGGAAKSVMVTGTAPETFRWHGTLQELVTLLLASCTSRGKWTLGHCVSLLPAVAAPWKVVGAVRNAASDTFY